MHGTRRGPAIAAAAALIVALSGCGGLGVNLRSGASNTPTQVAITAATGPTLNPYPLLIGRTVLLTAHPSAGNVVNYGVAQPVRWDSSNPAVGVLLEPDCGPTHLYAGEYTATICVFGGGLGKANSNVDGITANGAIGTLTIAVTN
jgi:hypothetical protein